MKNYVDLPAPGQYSPEYEPLVWAKKHCPSYITNTAVQKGGDYYYRFFFSSEVEMAAFILRWS